MAGADAGSGGDAGSRRGKPGMSSDPPHRRGYVPSFATSDAGAGPAEAAGDRFSWFNRWPGCSVRRSSPQMRHGRGDIPWDAGSRRGKPGMSPDPPHGAGWEAGADAGPGTAPPSGPASERPLAPEPARAGPPARTKTRSQLWRGSARRQVRWPVRPRPRPRARPPPSRRRIASMRSGPTQSRLDAIAWSSARAEALQRWTIEQLSPSRVATVAAHRSHPSDSASRPISSERLCVTAGTRARHQV